MTEGKTNERSGVDWGNYFELDLNRSPSTEETPEPRKVKFKKFK